MCLIMKAFQDLSGDVNVPHSISKIWRTLGDKTYLASNVLDKVLQTPKNSYPLLGICFEPDCVLILNAFP